MTTLNRFVVVLHEPQDLVNVALVVRAMKNMGLRRLRVVRAAEPLDPRRILGIAHDTHDVVDAMQWFESLDEALADLGRVIGTSARRRASRIQWKTPEEAAAHLLEQAPATEVALLFGREDKGLTNRDLDRCQAVISIPTDSGHPSMNLAHAALIVFYELRKAATRTGEAKQRDLSPKKGRQSPPATAAELESFFRLWEKAMMTIDFFYETDALPKMRSFRAIFQRVDMDRRELGLMRAVAYEVIHHASRSQTGISDEVGESTVD